MKYLMLAALCLAFVGCKSTPPAPQPPVVVPPTPTPPPTDGPLYSQWDASQEFCKSEGKHFNCGNPVWYGLKGCAPDSDGDNHAEGTAYFASLNEIKELAEKNSVTIKVKMKDGSVVQYGVGFASPCSEM